ncbi:FixJ family two-component response regulator [Bradyrhizobium sp. F1.13.1]
MRLIGLPGTRADKPKYDFRIRIGGPFLDLGGATESVLLPRAWKVVLSMLSMISVVDDDELVREATDNLLSSEGYLVHTFASAEEFLQSPQVNDCACVVADVQMTGMSGVDLLIHMRAQGHSTPFVFITAFPEDRVRDQARKAGAIGFLAKPFTAPDLIKHVEAAIGGGDAG